MQGFGAHLGPAPFHEVYRLQYQSDTDTMYLTGYSGEASDPAHNLFPGFGYGAPAYATKNLGPYVARYDHWLKQGNGKPTWAVRIPYGGPKHDNEHACAAALSVAGDFFFVGYEGLFDDANSGRIQVYRTKDGGYVGSLHAGPRVRQHRRRDGHPLRRPRLQTPERRVFGLQRRRLARQSGDVPLDASRRTIRHHRHAPCSSHPLDNNCANNYNTNK